VDSMKVTGKLGKFEVVPVDSMKVYREGR